MYQKELPPVTCRQGVNSTTFHPPPGQDHPGFTVPELYDWHHKHSPEHPYFIYFDESLGTKITILWRDVVEAVYRVANSVAPFVAGKSEQNNLVALCSSSDTLTYLVSMIGIMRAGVPVFLLSSRASVEALSHLLENTGTIHLVMNEENYALQERVNAARSKIQEHNPHHQITFSYIPPWKELFPDKKTTVEPPKVDKYDLESLCLILHSSGSTTLPRTNLWTHSMVAPCIWQPWYGELDICGQVMSTPSIPMSGATGVMQSLFAASSGLTLSGFKPSFPPVVPTPQATWESMVKTSSTFGFALQPFFALWVEDPEKVKVLSKLNGIFYGGAPFPKMVGDRLAAAGAKIFPLFGSSECGLLAHVFTKSRHQDWEYFAFFSLVRPAFLREDTDGQAELVIEKCPTHQPTKLNIEFNGVSAYATGDLLKRHPDNPSLWKFICRVVDQETIGHAIKINAVAFERMLMADSLIAGAVLFSLDEGSLFGAIIDPVLAYAPEGITTSDEAHKYKKLIWSTIEKYNLIAPEGATLKAEKLVIASPLKPLVYSEKGMPRRKQTIDTYLIEIRNLA